MLLLTEKASQREGCGYLTQLVQHRFLHAVDAGSTSWCSNGFFSYSQVSVQTLLWCSWYSSPAQSHISVHTLKMPSTGSHTTVWTLKNRAQTRSTLKDDMWQGIESHHISNLFPALFPWKDKHRKVLSDFQCSMQMNQRSLNSCYCHMEAATDHLWTSSSMAVLTPGLRACRWLVPLGSVWPFRYPFFRLCNQHKFITDQ